MLALLSIVSLFSISFINAEVFSSVHHLELLADSERKAIGILQKIRGIDYSLDR